MATIKNVYAREILNAKGFPTVETTVVLNDDTIAVASSPAGTSVSSYEALDLRDNDQHRYRGKGVLKAVAHVNAIIAKKIIGMGPTQQQDIDNVLVALDASPNKQTIGGNALLSVSMAVAKAGAKTQNKELFQHIQTLSGNTKLFMPTPLFNIVNGGKHAVDTFDFQEFIVIPASSTSIDDAMQTGFTLYNALKDVLKINNLSTLVGDEGGFAPHLPTNKDALALLQEAAATTNKRLGFDVFFGLDAASTTFYRNNEYHIKDKERGLTSVQLIDFYKELVSQFPILYLEDILAEDDWEGWTEAVRQLGKEHMIVGDDVISTNPARLTVALEKNAITATIIKPNQIGTVSETIAVVKKAQDAGLKIIVSHRSGETNDDFIADFAVGVGAQYAKCGAPVRGERVAKYNRLLAIERFIHIK